MRDLRSSTAELSFSFAACISDDRVLRMNLLASPCLQAGSPHEVILLKNCPSAADGLNLGLARSQRERIACVQQDVVLSEDWDLRLAKTATTHRAWDCRRRSSPAPRSPPAGGRTGCPLPPHASSSTAMDRSTCWAMPRGVRLPMRGDRANDWLAAGECDPH